MPTGAILSKFSKVAIETADDKEHVIHMNVPAKIAVKIFGIPHIGFRHRSMIIFRWLRRIDKKDKILDAGCGYGVYSIILADKGYKVNSVDIEKRRIDALNSMKEEYPKIKDMINTKVSSLTKLPYKNEEFDIVLCSEVLEHIKEHEKAFFEISRVLKKGGFLIFSVPTNSEHNEREYKKFGHERPGYSTEDIKKLAKDNGLELLERDYYDYFFGNAAFQIHNKFTNKITMTLSFWPLYMLSLLDRVFRSGTPNGGLALLKKI